MPWLLELSATARKAIADLPRDARREIGRALERLRQDPRSVDLKKLRGRQGEWRLRVGEYRVELHLDNQTGTIHVLDAGQRGSAYRD
ncbi:MAG: type II toxin-antitoxin system RelE/ParE family toxin [Chloroflexi bacterium]|nr:type II toxin-antitoxin system RelE/ParE family toxin [Chloroflexota bacterium]